MYLLSRCFWIQSAPGFSITHNRCLQHLQLTPWLWQSTAGQGSYEHITIGYAYGIYIETYPFLHFRARNALWPRDHSLSFNWHCSWRYKATTRCLLLPTILWNVYNASIKRIHRERARSLFDIEESAIHDAPKNWKDEPRAGTKHALASSAFRTQ